MFIINNPRLDVYIQILILFQINLKNLKVYVAEYKPDIIALTECMPKNFLSNNFQKRSELVTSLQIDGYELFHNWLEPGRGVGIYVEKIKATAILP